MKVYEKIENELIANSDKKYSDFNKKLCPDTKRKMLGVKVPVLRKIAKNMVKTNEWKDFLSESRSKDYFEVIMLQGLVIAYSKEKLKDKMKYMEKYIPKMDSWAITDTVVPTLKIKETDLEKYWNFIFPYAFSKNEFEVRFSIISMLNFFLIDEYIEKVIDILNKINHEGYYVKMAKAWTLAEIGIKYNGELMKYLNSNNNLDKFTYNKTLQKMIESYRVSDKEKILLKSMKKR